MQIEDPSFPTESLHDVGSASSNGPPILSHSRRPEKDLAPRVQQALAMETTALSGRRHRRTR